MDSRRTSKQDMTHLTHLLDTEIHGEAPVQYFGMLDAPKPSRRRESETWPDHEPPAAPLHDDNNFKAGSLSNNIQFWKERILPFVGLSERDEATIIKEVEHGVDVHDYLKAYTGYLGDMLVVNEKDPPAIHLKNHKMTAEDAEHVRADIRGLLEANAIQLCEESDLHLIQPLGVVSQPTKKRTIYDARWLNLFCEAPQLRYESLPGFVAGVEKDDGFWKMDFKSGFHHVKLTKSSYKYFGFYFEGKFYCWRVLPFGWCVSPAAFQRITKAFSCFTARTNILRLCYLDDLAWSVRAAVPTRIKRWLVFQVFKDAFDAGFFVAKKKSIFETLTAIELLGFVVDSHQLCFKVPESKRDRYFALLSDLTAGTTDSKGKHVPLRMLETTVGKLQSLGTAVPTVSLFLRQAYATIAAGQRNTQEFVYLPPTAARDLKELFKLHEWNGLAKWPQAFSKHVKIWTDACSRGWGVSFYDRGTFKDYHGGFPAFMEEEIRIHTKERLAVQFAFELLPQATTDTLVHLYTDNTIVQHTLLKGSAKDNAASQLARQLMWLQLHNDIRIQVFRVPTLDNPRSDWLSRIKANIPLTPSGKRSFMINRAVFLKIQQLCGVTFTIDATADIHDRQTHRYVALQDADTDKPVAINAFSYNFKREVVWCNPPWALIAPLWLHFKSVQATGVMLTPRALDKQWWPMLITDATQAIIVCSAGQRNAFTCVQDGADKACNTDMVAFSFNFKA